MAHLDIHEIRLLISHQHHKTLTGLGASHKAAHREDDEILQASTATVSSRCSKCWQNGF